MSFACSAFDFPLENCLFWIYPKLIPAGLTHPSSPSGNVYLTQAMPIQGTLSSRYGNWFKVGLWPKLVQKKIILRPIHFSEINGDVTGKCWWPFFATKWRQPLWEESQHRERKMDPTFPVTNGNDSDPRAPSLKLQPLLEVSVRRPNESLFPLKWTELEFTSLAIWTFLITSLTSSKSTSLQPVGLEL